MKFYALALLTMFTGSAALANSNFVTSPYLPYPPGCALVPDAYDPGWLETHAVRFFTRSIRVYNSRTGEEVPLTLEAFRSPCSEPNRSLVWLRFSLAPADARYNFEWSLPAVWAQAETPWSKPMHLVTEPNGWRTGALGEINQRRFLVSQPEGALAGEYAEFLGLPAERHWLFLLDGEQQNFWETGPGLTALEYNSRFTLDLGGYLRLEVPATADLLPGPAPSLPLSGRLSGVWGVEGAADQGFQLAISEPVRAEHDPEPLLLFFTHYTFDADGNPVWLVGNAEFEPGATEVTVSIEKVDGGVFRGDQRADRETIGSIKLVAHSCNDIGFEFDYSGLGLGTGIERLQRLFSLEVAGYDCRDYEARVAANQEGQ